MQQLSVSATIAQAAGVSHIIGTAGNIQSAYHGYGLGIAIHKASAKSATQFAFLFERSMKPAIVHAATMIAAVKRAAEAPNAALSAYWKENCGK